MLIVSCDQHSWEDTKGENGVTTLGVKRFYEEHHDEDHGKNHAKKDKGCHCSGDDHGHDHKDGDHGHSH